MYKYSVIIPNFNSGKKLITLLSSIPASQRDDILVIIVDDGSTQDLMFLNPYLSDNIVLINNCYGKGAGGARNTGLDYADSEWVVFADSDDWFCNGAFDIIDSKVDKNYEFNICYFKPTSINLNTGKVGTRHKKIESLINEYINKPIEENAIKLNFSHYVPWSKVISKKLIEDNKIRFDETIIANDGMFSAKCSLAAKSISASKEVIYCVTESPYSLTKVLNKNYFFVRLEVFCRMYHELSPKIKIL